MFNEFETFKAGYIKFKVGVFFPVTVDYEYRKLACLLVISGCGIDIVDAFLLVILVDIVDCEAFEIVLLTFDRGLKLYAVTILHKVCVRIVSGNGKCAVVVAACGYAESGSHTADLNTVCVTKHFEDDSRIAESH